MSLLKEPLVHFIVFGLALFWLYSAVSPYGGLDNKVLIDAGRVESLAATFERTWNRPPTNTELKAIVDSFVVEEIYARRALEMGLDQNDTVIRRRLRQKMEFLTADAAQELAPTDAELGDYLETHPDKFRTDSLYSFEQVFITTDRAAPEVAARVRAVQRALEEGQSVNSDPSMLPTSFDRYPAYQVNRNFGRGFSPELDKLPLNTWSAPIQSSIGIHFINLRARIEGTLPPLADIRETVEREWLTDRNEAIKATLSSTLLSEYEVEIEWPEQTP